MATGAAIKKIELEQSKDQLASLQNAMLERADELGVDPESFSKGKLRKGDRTSTAQNGAGIHNDWTTYVQQEALRQGVNPDVISNLVFTESRFKPNAVSKRGAKGIMQFTPATAKQYGLSEAQLTSNDSNDVQKVISAGVQHFKGLLNKYNHDYTLALAAYNGGPGSVDYVKKQTGNSKITGQDWMNFMQNKRQNTPSNKPHAWQNETYEYVTNIMQNNPENFGANADRFRDSYYTPDVTVPSEGTLPPVTIGVPRKVTPPTVGNSTPTPSRRIGRGEDYTFNYEDPTEPVLPTNASNFDYTQILPELYAAATNRVEPVFAQTYSPDLYQPYSVSFQDRRNLNNQTFRAVSQRLTENPSALSTLAAQKYEADNQVNAEEFRINQGIQNDIINRNTQLLNDAELTNLKIADTQYVRQAQARSNTKAVNQGVLNSISSKLLQHQLENRILQVYENLYPDYRYDENYQLQKVGTSGFDQLNSSGADSYSPINPATSTRVTRDATGKVQKITESTPSFIKQQMDNNKLDKSVNQMIKEGSLFFDTRTKSLRTRYNDNYSPLKGYDYSK